MYYKREKTAIISMISTVLICGLYALNIFNKQISMNPDIIYETRFWALSFTKLIPILIVAQIIIHIIFAIINKIITNQDISAKDDEMAKIINIKSAVISGWVCTGSIFISIISQAAGVPTFVMIVILISSVILSMIVSEAAKIYFYRRGL